MYLPNFQFQKEVHQHQTDGIFMGSSPLEEYREKKKIMLGNKK